MNFLARIGFFLILGAIFLPHHAQALTISPVRVEVSADPGGTVKGELLLINEQEGNATFYSSFGNFEASGESGTPNFVEGQEGLATWITTSPQVTLDKNEQLKVPYTIQVPQDATPGGHFAAIFWSTTPPASAGGGVSVGAKIGTLVLLRVSGDIPEGGKVLDFGTDSNRNFFSSLPVLLTWRFQNGGGDRIKPQGDVTITNLFGFTSATLSANPKDGNVLPQSIRKFEVLWEKPSDKEKGSGADAPPTGGFFTELKNEWDNFAFGRYTAHLDISYGSEGETAQVHTSFFIVPWRVLTVAAISLVVLFLLLSFGLRRYNRWIIAKAKLGS